MYTKFNWSLWHKLGGKVGSEPYVDHEKTPSGKEWFRAYIDSDIYSSWDDFKEQALLVVKAHLLQLDPRHEGQYIRRPYAEEIADRPHHLLEDCGDYWITWINATCPNEAAFEVEKQLAQLELEEIKAAKEKYGEPLWRFQIKPFATVKYPSATNEPDDNEVMQLLKRNGIR